MPSPLTALVARALEENKITVEDKTVTQFVSFIELLNEWNRVFNLTGIQDVKESVYLHLIDSLLAAPFLQGERCLDVGSGGGLPGIPLAILFPAQHWTLLDKNGKKTRFLTQAVAQLSLKNVKVVHERSENFHAPLGFDSILSRAFGTLRKMVEATAHLLGPAGKWVAMKGCYPTDELHELPAQMTYQVSKLVLRGMDDVKRHVVCMSRSSRRLEGRAHHLTD